MQTMLEIFIVTLIVLPLATYYMIRVARKWSQEKRRAVMHLVLANLCWLFGPCGTMILAVAIAQYSVLAFIFCFLSSLALMWPAGNYLERAYGLGNDLPHPA